MPRFEFDNCWVEYEIGDCLEMMKRLPDNFVDLVFTSPPFKDEDVIGDYWGFYDTFFKEVVRVASKAVVILHTATKINHLIRHYPPKRLMIWAKGYSQQSFRYNPILVYQVTDMYKVNKYIWSDCLPFQAVIGDKKTHQYEDPVGLYICIISMFRGCDIVLDPFLGSGTTLLACRKTGRNGIGFEINPEYEPIIRKRIMADTKTIWQFGGEQNGKDNL